MHAFNPSTKKPMITKEKKIIDFNMKQYLKYRAQNYINVIYFINVQVQYQVI